MNMISMFALKQRKWIMLYTLNTENKLIEMVQQTMMKCIYDIRSNGNNKLMEEEYMVGKN